MGPGKLLMSVVLCMLLGGALHAHQYAFRIVFTNKAGSATIADSALFLSSRALERRAAQGIVIDSTDRPVSPAYIDSVLTLTGGLLHTTSKWLNSCVVLLDDSASILSLSGKPYISSIQQVGYYDTYLHSGARTASGATKVAKTTSDAAYYGYTYTQTAMVNGDYLHNLGYKGQNKLIALLDAGYIEADIDRAFDSLRSSGRLADVHNFTLDTDYVYAYDIHGTNVLSTMAAYVPDTFVGSAPLASYALYVTEDGSSEQPIELDNMASGMERADSIGADIISTSLGYNTFDNSAYNFNFATDFDGKSTVAARAANIATRKGILVVATAGNEGDDSWRNILTPGDADSALTVGSVMVDETPAASSGYGPTNAAGQIKPDVCTLGQPANIVSYENSYTASDGTSFSTPQIAGWAACLWQASPAGTTPGALRRAIDSSADHYTMPGAQIGYGIPNFERAATVLDVKDTPTINITGSWVNVYPNPFTKGIYVTVVLNSDQNIGFTLLDITGKTVAKAQQNFHRGTNAPLLLPTNSNLPSGVYFLKATSSLQQQVIKVVKL